MSGASETLKRKSSAIQGSASRKNPRRDVPSFIPKPDDADLRVPGKLTVEKLRMIMELDMTQFKEMTGLLRGLAKHTLNVNATLASQSADDWENFKAEACERQPLFCTKYEDAWPISVYMDLYLYSRAATGRNLCLPTRSTPRPTTEESIPSVDRHVSLSPTPTACISRPLNEVRLGQLGKSSMDELRVAMGLNRSEFNKIRNCFMALAHKHLDIDVTFARQSPAKWQAFEQEALKAQPQFSTKFEGAWPLRVYMKRYLAKKRPRPHADSQHPHQITHKLSSPKATTPRLSEVRSECDDDENRESTSSPLPSIASDCSLSNVTTSSDKTKDSLPEEQTLSMSMLPPNDSALVAQFLRSLDPTLEHLLDLFINLGVRDAETLASFQRLSKENRDSLLRGKLNDLQLLGLNIYFDDA